LTIYKSSKIKLIICDFFCNLHIGFFRVKICTEKLLSTFLQLHLEAAHVLKYSEEEFLQTLDWKPMADNGNEKAG
jgi:hypothetical protein